MAELGKVSPNRMELLKNKRRHALAKRGHKLLKDKYDELIRRFVSFVKESKELRTLAEEYLEKLYAKFTTLRAETSETNLLSLIERVPLDIEFDAKIKNLLNIKVPIFTTKPKLKNNYSQALAPLAFDSFLNEFSLAISALVKLAEFEQTARMLAKEIESTRRRVNALEHVLIPSLEKNIRFISMKMDEIDRENRTRLMKTKELLLEAGV